MPSVGASGTSSSKPVYNESLLERTLNLLGVLTLPCFLLLYGFPRCVRIGY